MLAPSLPRVVVAESRCQHCRQPLPRGSRGAYCCSGCERVHDLLARSGLDRFYVLRGDAELAPVADRAGDPALGWLELLESEQSGAATRRISLDVQGLSCGACVWLIEALFKRNPDAYRIEVNPGLGRLSCVIGPAFPLRELVLAIESFGYRLGPAHKQGGDDSLLLRTGVCAALAVNNLLLGASTYFGLSEGPAYELVQNGSFVLATASALVGGSYFVDRAYQSLRRGVLHLDLPIALGMGLAYVGSVWSLYFGGARASYLDTVSVFIALMLVGRLLQERLVERNRRQLLANDGASGLLTRRISEGKIALVPCPELAAGDRLLICPGEIVPVAARLLEPSATCSLDWINGESEPRSFARGDRLVAGAINAGREAFTVESLTAFERSDLDALLRDDSSAKARLRGDFWDRLARYYVGGVLLVTALGALVLTMTGSDLLTVLDISTAMLVVTCPCAFGIATPLAYELAVSALRRAGLFVRDGSFFDRAAAVRRIVFDKTGTLTTGSLVLRDPRVLLDLSREQRQVLYDLAARSNHPKSAAVAKALVELDAELRFGEASVREVPGAGLELAGPVRYRLGAASWASDGRMPGKELLFTADGRVLSVLRTSEVSRPDAPAEARALSAEGYELFIASGDAQGRVLAMAEQLGIAAHRAHGDLDPQGKRTLIRKLSPATTLMIGDGINDGPALSEARVSGTPAVDRPFVPARADFYFLTPGLLPVRLSLRAAKAVRRVVKNALIFATGYNVFAVSLCLLGWMKPWLAALLMPASSLAVLTYTATALSPRRELWKS